ncbi:hypothetical protein IQ238_12350 [Pleurocapsales cyanobacterium LEGE 06147]|nr:hypothetical protein [Pleurocapsales cyanobacterium LEGE 06147]
MSQGCPRFNDERAVQANNAISGGSCVLRSEETSELRTQNCDQQIKRPLGHPYLLFIVQSLL